MRERMQRVGHGAWHMVSMQYILVFLTHDASLPTQQGGP